MPIAPKAIKPRAIKKRDWGFKNCFIRVGFGVQKFYFWRVKGYPQVIRKWNLRTPRCQKTETLPIPKSPVKEAEAEERLQFGNQLRLFCDIALLFKISNNDARIFFR
jgi:hypothetical protein